MHDVNICVHYKRARDKARSSRLLVRVVSPMRRDDDYTSAPVRVIGKVRYFGHMPLAVAESGVDAFVDIPSEVQHVVADNIQQHAFVIACDLVHAIGNGINGLSECRSELLFLGEVSVER
jgi:hypothetical protein